MNYFPKNSIAKRVASKVRKAQKPKGYYDEAEDPEMASYPKLTKQFPEGFDKFKVGPQQNEGTVEGRVKDLVESFGYDTVLTALENSVNSNKDEELFSRGRVH